jgi:membrane-anchored protein YejM (alkaline phosphatase superfamily)
MSRYEIHERLEDLLGWVFTITFVVSAGIIVAFLTIIFSPFILFLLLTEKL